MIDFIKEILKTTRFLVAMAAVTAMFFLLSPFVLWSAVSAGSAISHYHKALRHHRQGNDREAVRELKAGPSSRRGLAESYSLAGKIAFDAKDYDKAERYFRNAIHDGGDHAELQHALAVTKIMRSFVPGHGLSTEGVGQLDEVASRWQSNGDAFVNLASALLHEGKTPRAVSSYRSALRTANVSKEGLVHLYNGLGVILTTAAKNAVGIERDELLNRARAQFRKAQYLEPGSIGAQTNRIMLDLFLAANDPRNMPRRNGIVNGARDFYMRHKKQTSSAFRYALYHNAALLAADNKDYAKAADAFTAALGVHPRSKIDAFNKAVVRLLATRGKPSADAIARAEAEITRFTAARSPTPHDTFLLLAALADIEYAWHDIDAATKHFEMAAKLIDDTTPRAEAANVYRALAIINYRDDRIPEAQQFLERALAMAPAMEDLEQITKRLKAPPGISIPAVVNKVFLPNNMPVIRTEIYNKSTSTPLRRNSIKITIDGEEALFDLTEHSQVVAIPAKPLADGVHQIKVWATDHLGNTNEKQTEIVIDNSPPTVTVSPANGARLEPGRHTFTITFHDKVSPIDHKSIKLTVSVSSKGKYDGYDLVREGVFTDRAGIDRAGEAVQGNSFSFELDKPLAPGKCNFFFDVSDTLHNELDNYKWGYTIEKEGAR